MPTPKRPRSTKTISDSPLTHLMPDSLSNMIVANGVDILKQLGMEAVQEVITDILSGKNLRSVTELLTRRRIATLNLALVNLFLAGTSESPGFIEQLPHIAATIYVDKSYRTSERILAQWILGLTNKAYQNVLRSDMSLVPEYRDAYIEACRDVVNAHQTHYGELDGLLALNSDANNQPAQRSTVNWLFFVYMLNAVGAQTLTVRGSDKSTYGKLFEKLVLGSMLYALDFTFIESPEQSANVMERVFWLSSRTTDKDREVDATLIYKPGQGVRFDIGFIGVGNTEITKDKTTRFRRNVEIAGEDYFMATIIIVDRVGENSRVPQLAEQLKNGYVVQMSLAFWPVTVARILNTLLGFEHPILTMTPAQITDYLRDKLKSAPLSTFMKLAAQDE